MHEKVSRMLAALRLSTPNRSPIFFEIFPTVRIATVLFAVQMFTIETRAAIESSAPRLLFTWAVILLMMKSIPPFSRMISSIPPAIMAMIMSSPMPIMPLPMAANQPKRS